MAQSPSTSTGYALSTGDNAQRAFFVRGHMRSGTNWTGALLNLHPDIYCTGEFHFNRIRDAFDAFVSRPWIPESLRGAKPRAEEAFSRFVADCLREVAEAHPEAKMIGDRTPAMLNPELNGAPVVYITRDGRDAIVSWAFHCLRMGKAMSDPVLESWRGPRQGRDFTNCPDELLADEAAVRKRARVWAKFVDTHHKYIDTPASAESRSPVLSVTYEELHADVDAGRNKMYRFLGLDPDRALPVSVESKTKAGFGSRPENPNSFYRAGKVNAFERYFTDDVKRWYKEEAGEALVAAGYEQDMNW